jgi:hypothetical protein
MVNYTSLKIVRELEFAWVYYPNGLSVGFGMSKGYFSFDTGNNLLTIVEDGRAQRPKVNLADITFQDLFLSESEINFVSYTQMQNLLAVRGCPLAVDTVQVVVGTVNTPYSSRIQYNGTSVAVPLGLVLTRIVSQNDPNTNFTGIVTGTNLVITGGVTNDIYLIDGYIPS